MKTYAVTITATITKTYTVEAENKQTADILAHEQFSVLSADEPENYDQETDGIAEVIA